MAQRAKNLPADSSCSGRLRFDSWVGKIPWGRKWQPAPVFLPGEFHGQRRLVGYHPWGGKESDMTEATKQQAQLSNTLPKSGAKMCHFWSNFGGLGRIHYLQFILSVKIHKQKPHLKWS